ncbi:MAG: DUF6687 family protein [Microthrixaceae bacterium]
MPLVAFSFAPYEEVGAQPNVIVDGTGTTNTTLTLSHWPGSPTVPASVQADLSAEMAFRYLDHRDALHGRAKVVSNNHFDQDGLVSIFALVDPAAARARRAMLEDLAAAGDFATYRNRDAARASMVISAFVDPARSPLGPLPADYGEATAHLYSEALGRLPELVDDIHRYHHLWADEDTQLTESEVAVASGLVGIEEHPDVDLAVVTVTGEERWSGHRFGGRRYDGVHPMAIHNATPCTALLLVAGGQYRFTYRYETWVQYRSRRLPSRVDLTALAQELSAADDVTWAADPIDGLTPELQPAGTSSISPSALVDTVLRHLRTAPPGFDPFTPIDLHA